MYAIKQGTIRNTGGLSFVPPPLRLNLWGEWAGGGRWDDGLNYVNSATENIVPYASKVYSCLRIV